MYICVLVFISLHQAVDDAFYHAGWVVGPGAEILVKVHGLLECFCGDFFIFNGDCEVQEVDLFGRFFELPLQDAKVVSFFFEIFPTLFKWIANPDAHYIIDKSQKQQ